MPCWLSISIEAMYLENLWKRGEEARQSNDQLDAGNSQMQRHIAELRSSAQKITAMFTRLNDGIIRVAGIEGRLPVPGRNPKSNSEYGESKVAKVASGIWSRGQVVPRGPPRNERQF